MKRILCFLLILSLLVLTGCGKNEMRQVYTDTLEFSNEDKTFIGAYTRYSEIVKSLKTRVNTLEECHNNEIVSADPDTYFNNSNYIFTMFDPFVSDTFDVCSRFDDNLTQENAAMIFSFQASGDSVVYTNEGDVIRLKFANEKLERNWKAEYKKSSDSFRIIYSEDSGNGTENIEFIEFAHVSDSTYAIKSDKAKCCIEYNEDGNIVSFSCVSLKDNSFSLEDSIYNYTKVQLKNYDKEIRDTGDDIYDKYYIYEDGLLTRYEMGTGVKIEIQIRADIYASAFIKN